MKEREREEEGEEEEEEEEEEAEERNPRPRQHLCPVLSVISSLLRKGCASTSSELSVRHTLQYSQ